jgi:hypothetical protein
LHHQYTCGFSSRQRSIETKGAHPLAIKERLGHSSITVTMDRYGGLFPRLEEAIGAGLDAVLRDSLAASVRPETASTVHLRRSAG